MLLYSPSLLGIAIFQCMWLLIGHQGFAQAGKLKERESKTKTEGKEGTVLFLNQELKSDKAMSMPVTLRCVSGLHYKVALLSK